jgi:uncharacterized protein DUF2490
VIEDATAGVRAAGTLHAPRRRNTLVAVFVTGLLAACPALADDVQFWPTLTVYSRTVDGWRGSAEVQARVSDDLGTYNRTVFRVNGGRLLTPRLELFAGYENTQPATAAVRHEQRLWEQVEYTGRPGRWSFASRLRLEQRFVEDTDRTAYRLRGRFRVQHRLARTQWNLLATDELWMHLNTVPAYAARGLDQNRLAVAASRAVNPHLSIEPGYMHIYTNLPAPVANRVAHVMTLQVTTKF